MRALPQPQKRCMQYSRNVLRPWFAPVTWMGCRVMPMGAESPRRYALRHHAAGCRMRSRSIQAIIRSASRRISSSVSSLPRGIWCHFSMHPRQHVAVACWAVNTGCPRQGVCLPSFTGLAAPTRERNSSQAWRSMVVLPFDRAYALSLSDRTNFERNVECESRSIVFSIHMRSSMVSMLVAPCRFQETHCHAESHDVFFHRSLATVAASLPRYVIVRDRIGTART